MEHHHRRVLRSDFLCVSLDFSFGTPAGFRHALRMRFVNGRGFGVICAFPFRVREFIEHQGIYRLPECTFVDPAVGYLNVFQITTVD